jgi:uncharacterized SAM-binding protein YcdF (DUF218 family)
MPWRFFVKGSAGAATVWKPWIGWCLLAAGLVISGFWWTLDGESFLSHTDRLPAEVLVVEGWIGRNGVRAAATEFEQRGYEYIVTSGGPALEHWEENPLSYAEMADRELIRSGIPKERIIVAPSKSSQTRRTYESALAVSDALQRRNIKPKAFNVFTLGSHARRSRLVFAKVEGPLTKVGVVAWTPTDIGSDPWWRSSERTKDLITETVGYAFEVLLNSGRPTNRPERN